MGRSVRAAGFEIGNSVTVDSANACYVNPHARNLILKGLQSRRFYS